jgi:hypothetical protein
MKGETFSNAHTASWDTRKNKKQSRHQDGFTDLP